ncbi:MAG: phenylacetate--CoA ligase [Alicyclobacillus macrosporangiidus]|uniref:phenylacetate--CoA ligase family protein n=1 Tax=Alicyclobacillus macrosporangiidus TaxID=392015 RepID=UPI0026F2B0B4|nr:phenylacetate--CoA ligase [Alicyclobacillus macrosporangiidus]MCL6600019.1 phenylacetate--CoA ligase [Alicyclobacillus macrosporangiidus]
MPRDELRRLQSERLVNTIRRVYERVPFYRSLFAEHGVKPEDIRGVEDIVKLPFTRKQDLREQYPFGLLAVDRTEVVRIHGSSGTKGKPTLVAYTRGDIDRWSECVARSIVTAGGRPNDVFHVIYGYGLFTGGLGFHYGAERLGMTVVPVSGGNTPRQVTLMEDLRPRGIAGTPSYVLNIAETMRQMGKDPAACGIEYGIFGAEPWSEEMRRTLQSTLGVKAMDVYGLSEVMGPGVSIECIDAQEGLHVAEDHFLVEVVDPETGHPLPPGETGELVFTTLTKEALPVIRYRTGDVANLIPERCRCGRTHVRMSRIKGRIDDMLIIRGVNVFPSELEAVVLRMPELTPHYQVVVDRAGALDTITLLAEVTERFAAAVGGFSLEHEAVLSLARRLGEQLKHTLGVTTEVRLCRPGELPRSEGKAVRVVDRRSQQVGR